MAKFKNTSAPPIQTAGKRLSGVGLGQFTDAGPSFMLNRISQARGPEAPGYDSDAFAPFCNQYGYPASLPGGVTQVTQALLAAPVATSASITEIAKTVVGIAHTFQWQNGPTTATFTAGVISATYIGPRHYSITFNSMDNCSVTWTGLSGTDLPTAYFCVETAYLTQYEAGSIFSPRWLAHFQVSGKEIRDARFMDWMITNYQYFNGVFSGTLPEVNWSARITPLHRDQRRMCVEYMVALCNLMDINPWFCLGPLWNDDYVRRFATYVKANLKPSLRPSFEDSNEDWNFGFGQSQQCVEFGQQYYGTNTGAEFLNYHVMRSTRKMRIIDAVYGTNKRYTRVLGWGLEQYSANLLTAPQYLAATPNEYVSPAQAHDAICVAIYFANDLSYGTTGEAIYNDFVANGQASAVSLLLSYVPAQLTARKANMEQWAALCKANNLMLYSYEGGQHITMSGTIFYRHIFTVPNGNAYTVGETATQGALTAQIVAKTATTIELNPLTNATWSDNTLITSPSVPAGQTPTALNTSNAKTGCLELFEAAMYSSAMTTYLATNRQNFIDAGGVLHMEFVDVYPSNRFGFWGLQRGLEDNNLRWLGFVDDLANKPRTKIIPNAKVTPAPTTPYAAYRILGLTEITSDTWRAQAGTVLTAEPTGLLGTETLSYSWRVNGVEKATGPTLTFSIDADYPVGGTLTCVTTINGTPYASRGVLIVA